MTDLATYWTTLDAEEAKRNAWKEGPRIMQEDLTRGSARVQRVTAAQWWDTHDSHAPAARAGGTKPMGRLHVMAFGKYRGRLMADVQDQDPSYFAWCVRDIGGFAAKARTAGLLEDEM